MRLFSGVGREQGAHAAPEGPAELGGGMRSGRLQRAHGSERSTAASRWSRRERSSLEGGKGGGERYTSSSGYWAAWATRVEPKGAKRRQIPLRLPVRQPNGSPRCAAGLARQGERT